MKLDFSEETSTCVKPSAIKEIFNYQWGIRKLLSVANSLGHKEDFWKIKKKKISELARDDQSKTNLSQNLTFLFFTSSENYSVTDDHLVCI